MTSPNNTQNAHPFKPNGFGSDCCLECGGKYDEHVPHGQKRHEVQTAKPSDTQNDTSELRHKVERCFYDELIDGSETLDDGIEYFDTTATIDRIVKMIAQREQAAELRGRIDELERFYDLTQQPGIEDGDLFSYKVGRLATLQATKPEKGTE